jgi:hypothetical protein
MASAEPKPERPYKFDTIAKPVSQTDMVMWQSTLWDFLKSTSRFKPLLRRDLTWTSDEDNNRGFTDDTGNENPKLTAAEKSDLLDSILLKIGTYGPKSAFIDITQRSTSYKYIWDAIRRVCGFPVPGAQLIHYMSIKNSFDPTGSQSYNDHYWRMRDHKIASLMTRESGIKFNGKPLDADETITPSMENQVVADWLESIGGLKLVKYVGQQYAKELETCSLYDLQETLGQQDIMQATMDRMNDNELATLNRAQSFNQSRQRQQGRQSQFNRKPFEKKMCYFCKELKNGKEKTHNTRDCFLRQKNKNLQPSNRATNYRVDADDDRHVHFSQTSSEDNEEDEDLSSLLQKMSSD